VSSCVGEAIFMRRWECTFLKVFALKFPIQKLAAIVLVFWRIVRSKVEGCKGWGVRLVRRRPGRRVFVNISSIFLYRTILTTLCPMLEQLILFSWPCALWVASLFTPMVDRSPVSDGCKLLNLFPLFTFYFNNSPILILIHYKTVL